jgi:hypothetical protein
MYDFNFLAPCPSSGIIIHGTADEVVPQESTAKLAEKLQAQRGIDVDYVTIPGASHFYENHMEQMIGSVETYLDKRLEG